MTSTSPRVEIRSYGRGGIDIHIRPRTADTADTIPVADIQAVLRTIADNLKDPR